MRMDHLRYFAGFAMQLVGLADPRRRVFAWELRHPAAARRDRSAARIDLRTRRLAAPRLALLPAFLCAFMGPVLLLAVA
jgi:hypothetical protein